VNLYPCEAIRKLGLERTCPIKTVDGTRKKIERKHAKSDVGTVAQSALMGAAGRCGQGSVHRRNRGSGHHPRLPCHGALVRARVLTTSIAARHTVDPTTKSSREPPPPARSIRTRSMLRLIIFLCLRLLCLLSVLPLPFRLTSGIISVCLDLAGLFRNKDIHLC